MRIVVTGASGFIGRPLVKDFLARGAQLLLVGRDPERLRYLFPGVESCSYEGMAERSQGYDGLLHLAVLNNNVTASAAEYREVNVELTKTVLLAAQRAGIPRFVYASTVQALAARNQSPYASSKRIASRHLAAAESMDVRILYLAAVVGETLSGRMAIIGRAPMQIRRHLIELYSALTPVTDVATVAAACWEALSDADAPREQIIARDQTQNPAFKSIKRCTDLVAALVILIPFSWLLAIIWLAVRLQSPGPGIFAQPRVGQNGQVFTCYKFRTMSKDSPNVGTHEASTSLVTPLGKVLRRTKLDELPQALNILLNQMSLVGPRPCLPQQEAVIAERQKRGVFTVKPGITGLAQVGHIDMSQPQELALWDARYVKLRSFRLDLSILVQTALGRGSGDAMDAKG